MACIHGAALTVLRRCSLSSEAGAPSSRYPHCSSTVPKALFVNKTVAQSKAADAFLPLLLNINSFRYVQYGAKLGLLPDLVMPV